MSSIDLGSKIRVTDNEELDIIYLLVDKENQLSIGISYIPDIEEL